MEIYLYLITVIAAITGIGFSVITRGILYHTPDTDNELMAYAAAQSHKWRWFSDLHKMGAGKTGMKDITIILISVFQKIFRNKTGDHPYVAMAGMANAFSSFLIYLIALEYWNPAIALFLSIFYLVSLWNWQIALYGGHANIATTLLLLSVLFVQQTNSSLLAPVIWLITAGIIFCFAQFASASTIKYTPLFLAAVFFERYRTMIRDEGWSAVYASVWNDQLYKFNILAVVMFLSGIILLRLFYKKIVATIYNQRAPDFLNKIISGRKLFPLDYYFLHARKRVKQLLVWGSWTVLGSLFLINLMGPYDSLLIVAGFIIGFLILTLPDIKKSFRYYFNFLLETQIRKKSHFRSYTDYFAKKGLTVSRYTQGAGLRWLPKAFFRMVPFHTIVFITSIIGSLYVTSFLPGNIWINYINIILLIAISVSPIIWAEVTKAPQLSRTYSPGLVGMLLSIGYGSYLLQIFAYNYFYPSILIALITTMTFNLWKFLSDVYPSRMSATKLIKILKNLKIEEIYTYRTNYNGSLVEAIPGLSISKYVPRQKIEPPLAVHYINSIADVRDGWIVIPGTNGKTLTMNGDPEAINNNFRFTRDPILNKLLESHAIEKVATVKIKTYGSSRIWSMECEVLGYMDLILHDIGSEDIFRGYAWLVHSSKLKPPIRSIK